MNARESILQAIRKTGTRSGVAVHDIAEVRPQLARRQLTEAFLAKATSEALTATAERLASVTEIPESVRTYMETSKIDSNEVLTGKDSWLLALNWGDISLTHKITRNPVITLTIADQAIAETGSLVVTSRPEQPFLLNYIGLHHLIIVRESSICAYMEDIAFGKGRSTGLITGTSGTADIEGRNTRGAHGPRFLHLLLIA